MTASRLRACTSLWIVLAIAWAVLWPPISGAQEMPNAREMSGVPLPVGDVKPGTITVRVIRGSFANPVSSQTVEITGGARTARATTNDIGRAEFTGLAAGTRVKATATVAGERLESQEFVVPASGGIRLVLVAADPAAEPSDPAVERPDAARARQGAVVLGDESRFVFELGEDGLSVFYVLQVLNPSSTPVQPERPLEFELPANARSASLLEGSSAQASVSGRMLTISGPFAPGRTLVQLGYTMPYSGSELVIEQKLPVRLEHVAVVAQKIGDMKLESPQVSEQRDMPAQGNLYIAGRGGPVAAGDMLRFSFSGMPHHATWPRTLAFTIAVLILAGGAWSAVRAGRLQSARAAEWKKLEARREHLFEELAALEERHREQAIDSARYVERRRELVAALEHVYAALDDEVAAGGA